MTALLFSEGVLDLGEGTPFADDSREGPLRVLIHNVLHDCDGLFLEARRLSKVHGDGERNGLRGFALKAFRALRDAEREGKDAVFIVVDEDGRPKERRLERLQEGRAAANHQPASAIGVAQPMVEAWLMGDADGWQKCFGADAPAPPANPEADTGNSSSRRYAKDVLWQLSQGHRGDDDRLTTYVRLAEQLDWRRVADACPRSFAPFAAEARANVAPVYGIREA